MKISKGIKQKPLCLLVYGPDGMGKSSLGAQFPRPIFIGPEDGSSFLDVARVEGVVDYKTFLDSLKELQNYRADYDSIIVDSLDWLEPLIHQHICKKYKTDSLEKASGGFGKGYKEAFDLQVELKNELKKLSALGFHIVLIAHSQVVTFNDPLTETPYDRYELKLHESKSVSPRAMWREFTDGVFFINKDIFTTGEGKNARANDSGLYIFTTRTPSYDAKRRVEMPDKIKFEKSGMFHVFETAFGKKEDLTSMYQETLTQAEGMKDAELRKQILAKLPKYKNDKEKLTEIQNYILKGVS